MSDIAVFDGHNDTLLRLYGPASRRELSFLVRQEEGHNDLPRAVEGHFAGGFYAVFVPSPSRPGAFTALEVKFTESGYEVPMEGAIDPNYALHAAFAMTAGLLQLEHDSAGRVRVVRAKADLDICLREDVHAMVLHFEGAEPIDADLNALHTFFRVGLRSLGIVWSRPNIFGHGVPFTFPHSPDAGPGLTPAGHALVKACNELGVQIDLSHLTEKGFWDVSRLSNAPLVATHSAMFELCPSPRNLTDKQLDAIRDSGGIVGINFHVGFLHEKGSLDPNAPLSEIVRHIEYAVGRMGIDHVGFGSDFDGATVPRELGDVSGWPRLIAALRARGFDDAALRKLARENWARVIHATWKD